MRNDQISSLFRECDIALGKIQHTFKGLHFIQNHYLCPCLICIHLLLQCKLAIRLSKSRNPRRNFELIFACRKICRCNCTILVSSIFYQFPIKSKLSQLLVQFYRVSCASCICPLCPQFHLIGILYLWWKEYKVYRIQLFTNGKRKRRFFLIF